MLHDYVFCADCEDIFNKGGKVCLVCSRGLTHHFPFMT